MKGASAALIISSNAGMWGGREREREREGNSLEKRGEHNSPTGVSGEEEGKGRALAA